MSKKRDLLYNKSKKLNMNIIDCKPLNKKQELVFNKFDDHQNLILHGYAGTGKTYIALFLALEAISEGDYKKLIIVRSAVPSRDMGFMPGSKEEKSSLFEEPYENIVNNLYQRGDAYSILKRNEIVDFKTTSYMRGVTYDDSIIIVDEIQNLRFEELDTIMTRPGENTMVIFCGDYRQTDLTKADEKKGLNKFLDIIKKMGEFSFINFEKEDIVRSDLVKKYIIAKAEYE